MPLFKASQYATNIVIPILFIYFSNRYSLSYLINSSAILLFVYFLLWSIFTGLFAFDLNMVFYTEKKKVLVLIYIMTIYGFSSYSYKNTIFSLQLLIYTLGCIIFYSYFVASSGLQAGAIREIDESLEGNSTILDSNGYGYFIFMGISAGFIIYDVYSNSKFYLGVLFSLIFLSFLIILSTASRGSYLIFLFLISFNLVVYVSYLKYLKNLKFILIIVLVFCIPYLSILQSSLIQDSKLEERFVNAQEGTTRELLFADAINVGLNNPFLGVGGGNYSLQPRSFEQGSFSHNSYSEAFANYGVLGLALLLLTYLEFLFPLIKIITNRKVKNKKVFFYFLSFLIAFMAYNIFYVTYLTIEFMGAFVIMRVGFDQFQKKHLANKNNHTANIF